MPTKPFVYEKLSYKIIGLLYEVYNSVGPGHREKYYQAGLQQLLDENKISYKKEVFSPLQLKDRIIGKYFLDFLIDDKIIIELKVKSYFQKKDIEQIYAYLKNNDLKLGILAYFTKSGVRIKRIVNL